MPLINTLESKFGRFAIPGLVNILAGFQVAVWVMLLIQPEFFQFLVLDRGRVFAGEVWRLVTWVFVPATTSPIWLLLMVWVMVMIGRALEQAWGAFRLNLYILGGLLAVMVGALIFGFSPEGAPFYTTMFLAFAMLYPNQELLVFFVLPVKVKYLGMIAGALLLLNFISVPSDRLPILFSIVNFLVAFGPATVKGMGQRAEVSSRRAKFDSAKIPDGEHFFKCAVCGKTDVTDPKQEFRVGVDGEEYCVGCLPKKA
ncbi:hypothetical protein FEM03_14045 [Phragmitibacter flavus]|uniref:Rhomboid family intramembrane serine protease n=1 Tax=Phragmitibacter flavus TaxID=2576071 RepID=A0A5R8KDB1_9BACT|nr:hypothetical protein [Phragmitibacter flavus]TLD70302.1 hypothetical protein FEM03_14045 [Phragmitibacter flavus]